MSPLLAARYPPRFPGFIFVGVQRASDRLPRHPSPFDYPVVCISDQPRARPGFDNRAGFQRDWDVKTEAEHTTRGSEDLARSANIPAPLPNHPELFASTCYTHLISLVAHFLSYTKPLDRDHGSDLAIEEAYRRNPIRKPETGTDWHHPRVLLLPACQIRHPRTHLYRSRQLFPAFRSLRPLVLLKSYVL
ncbi:hypothetical protein RSOLAG22IIIB_12958 [Rhizoctonia solani]|uniref:Uncharacterized protein n=1 Tax=Rhizoctonia solani TaxID=456999 RepID=A0A0K6GI19_9AGAM|nr:hypothetical protein RSOLAG22IIIB_12958 [Rhizoctonia solani]